MNARFKKVLICFVILVIFTLLYLLSFRLNLDFISPVYTYKGVCLIIVFSVLLFITLSILKNTIMKSLDFKDIIIVILLFSLIHLLIFCMIPVTIERSFSVSMLSEMYNRDDHTLDLVSTENIFIDKYVKENQAFDKRFKEQIVTGTIKQIGDNTYSLTDKGIQLVKAFHLFDKIFNVNSNLLK